MCTKEEFRQRVGVVNLDVITNSGPCISWCWYKYGPLLCFGKEDHQCAVGIIYQYQRDVYDLFGCWAPGIPPFDDNCIIFMDKNGNYLDEQDSLITDRALAALPRASGKMDGITLEPSGESNIDSLTNGSTTNAAGMVVAVEAPAPQRIVFIGLGAIIIPVLAYLIYKAITGEKYSEFAR